MLHPIVCAFIVLLLFVLLTLVYLWVDSIPREKKHKRIKNVRGMK